MSIVRGVANSQDITKNCVLMEQTINQVGGGRVVAYVLYIDGKPVDHSVNREWALAWYDARSAYVENPVKVGTVAMHNVGGLSVLTTIK